MNKIKRQLQLIIGILGYITMMGFPAAARANRLEDFNSIPNNRQTVNGLLYMGERSPAHSRYSQKLAEAPPAPSGNLVEKASRSNQFQTLAAVVKAAGLTETLSAEGPYTVFAPTDKAFASLPPGTLEKLLKPENKELLMQMLAYHIVPGEVTASELQQGKIESVSGKSVAVRVDGTGHVRVNRAKVIQPNIQASNGVIHAIDRVILPPQILVQLNAAPSHKPNQAY